MIRLKRTIAALCVSACIGSALLPSAAFAVERYQVMMEGDEDKWVEALQEELYERGYLNVKPTGYFGEATVEAVKKYQQKKGLTVDGVAGIATQKKLFGKYYEAIPEARAQYVAVEEEEAAQTSDGYKRYQVLMFGDSDAYVEQLQKALKKKGYLDSKATGYFGEATLTAVVKFQEDNDLTADGIVGVKTQKALYGSDYEAIPSTRKVVNSASSEDSDEDFESLRKGSAGVLVETIQKRLIKYGYLKGDTTEYFGSATEQAVKNFQKANELTADGVVGKETYSLLFTVYAVYANDAGINAVSTSAAGAGSSSSSSGVKTEAIVDTGRKGDNATIEKAIDIAISLLGSPYKYGAEGPNKFDCSGFTSYVLEKVGVDCPRSSKEQGNYKKWDKVSFGGLQRGDLIIFTNTRITEIGHVGIYLGDGRFIHCTSGKAYSVAISYLEGSYVDRFLWGMRWAPDAGTVGTVSHTGDVPLDDIPIEVD